MCTTRFLLLLTRPSPSRPAGVAFNGWADPWKALDESWGTYDKLPGNKWISLGGGNGNGRFTWNNLNEINNAINGGSFNAYHGIVFDVEEGDSGLASSFRQAFQTCKNKGIAVMVTVSHSAPYGISDAYSLMDSFFHDGNIDFLSPQLYTSGEEGGNDFTTTMGVPWSSYGSWNTKAKVIPSIVKADFYWDAAGYLGTQGVDIKGFVQWSQ